MINTTKFTNGIQARYDELLRDPVKWGIMKNLAYASIRDDVEKIIKHTNKNSADTFINADNLIQNLKSHNINQYIEAGTLTQNINLSDTAQLNQILINSDVIQVINRQEVIKKIDKMIMSDLTLFFNNKYALIAYFPDDGGRYVNASFANLPDLRDFFAREIVMKYSIDKSFENIEGKQNVQGITYKTADMYSLQTNVMDSTAKYLVYNLEYGTHPFEIVVIIISLSLFNIQNPLKDSHVINNNLFGSVISDRAKLGDFLGRNFTNRAYNRNVGGVVKNYSNLFNTGAIAHNVDKLFNMNN